MERVVLKKALCEEATAPLFVDRKESLRVFAELLRRGRGFYTHLDSQATTDHDDTPGRFARVYRIVALKGS